MVTNNVRPRKPCICLRELGVQFDGSTQQLLSIVCVDTSFDVLASLRLCTASSVLPMKANQMARNDVMRLSVGLSATALSRWTPAKSC